MLGKNVQDVIIPLLLAKTATVVLELIANQELNARKNASHPDQNTDVNGMLLPQLVNKLMMEI